jgi:hypothetical protein
MSQQRFVYQVKYDEPIPDSMFEAAITYDAKQGPRKR